MVPRNPFAPVNTAAPIGVQVRARNPFAPATLATSTGGILGPSAQVVDNAVAILAANLIAVIKAVNGCDAVLTNDALFDQWQSFTGIVEAFIKANEDASPWSISGDEILAQVDQLQGQLDQWKAKLAAVCPDIADVPEAPKREETDHPLFSVPTGLIVGAAIALGILIVWKVP